MRVTLTQIMPRPMQPLHNAEAACTVVAAESLTLKLLLLLDAESSRRHECICDTSHASADVVAAQL